jgi:transposase
MGDVVRYNKAFKLEAIRLATMGNSSIAQVASGLGIHVNTLYKRIKQFNADGDKAFPGSGNLKPEDEELRRLRKQVADLQEEVTILKKAMAYFAKNP